MFKEKHLKALLPTTPISDRQWKEHQAIKQVLNVDDLNTYAGELATEMRIYCHNRLENINENMKAVIKRLKQLKPKKRPVKRQNKTKSGVDKKADDI